MTKVICIVPSLCSQKSYVVLNQCINSLIKSSKLSAIDIKIVVVTDGKKLFLDNLKNKINLLVRTSYKYYSFTKMNNKAIKAGIRKYKPDWILFINDDAYIDKNFFYEFQKISNDRADIIVPIVHDDSGKAIDSFGVEYFKSGHAKNSLNIGTKTQLASLACLIVNAKILNRMFTKYNFYFNDVLSAYLDDAEFSIRAKGIGAKIIKSAKMISYHRVSYTNGKRSNYVIYQTFRNLIWIVIMTWPFKTIAKNILKILAVQLAVIVWTCFEYGPFIYLKLLVSTFRNLKKLLALRNKIVPNYLKSFKFESIFSEYSYRTHSGINIKL
jgi:GT2 family glycosyltransferase